MNSQTTSATTPAPRALGRPSTYSADIARHICDLLVHSSKSLRWICLQPGMPSRSTVYDWLNENPKFRRLYTIAREEQLELLADEIIEIIDDSRNDWDEGETGPKVNNEAIARARLRVAGRQWLITHLNSKSMPVHF